MTPEYALNSGQPLATKHLIAMLARHGFAHKRTTGSHIICTHTVYSDEIVGLVYNSTDIVYQKNAAKACLRVLERAQTQQNTAAQTASALPDLPDDLEYYKQGQRLYVRHREAPVLGFAYEGADNIEYAYDVIRQDVETLKHGLAQMRSELEFDIQQIEDGSLHIKHPTYPLEEIILPYGTLQQASYPMTTLQYLADYTDVYDSFVRSYDIEGALKRASFAVRYNMERTTEGLFQYSITRSRHWIATDGKAEPCVIVATPKGRMTPASSSRYMKTIMDARLWHMGIWTKSGLNMQDRADGTMHITHDLMEVDFVMESPIQLGRALNETLDLVNTGTTTLEETEEWVDKLRDISERIAQAGQDFSNLYTMIISHYDRWHDAFAEAARKLGTHGYLRSNNENPQDGFGTVSFTHPDPACRDLTMRVLPQGPSNRQTFVVVPYKKMIDAMNDLIAECDRKKDPRKPKAEGHALLRATGARTPAPLFNTLNLGQLAEVKGVNIAHGRLGAETMLAKAKAGGGLEIKVLHPKPR